MIESFTRLSIFAGNYTSNGILLVSCNGGLNQMRSAVGHLIFNCSFKSFSDLMFPNLDECCFSDL